MQIVGLEGLSDEEFHREIERGARFVYFEYCVSLCVITLKQPTSIYFIRAGESTFSKSIGWTLLTLAVGWWGIPFGIIYTIWVLVVNLGGGNDVTEDILSSMRDGNPREDHHDPEDDRSRWDRSRRRPRGNDE